MSRSRELGFARWAASILFARKIYSVFSWSDPGPFAQVLRERIVNRWSRGTARLRRMLRKSS